MIRVCAELFAGVCILLFYVVACAFLRLVTLYVFRQVLYFGCESAWDHPMLCYWASFMSFVLSVSLPAFFISRMSNINNAGRICCVTYLIITCIALCEIPFNNSRGQSRFAMAVSQYMKEPEYALIFYFISAIVVFYASDYGQMIKRKRCQKSATENTTETICKYKG